MTKNDILKDANGGIVGINKNLEVYGGYDDEIPEAAANYERPEWLDEGDDNPMPPTEKTALADHMIELWEKYKSSAT